MHALLMLAALAGHCLLWITFVNRIHGVGLNRWVVDGLTLLAAVLLAGAPAVVLWRWLAGVPLPTPFAGAMGPLGWYASACVPLAVYGTTARFLAARSHERTGALLAESSRVIDLQAKYGDELAAPGSTRFFARLPGNEVLKPVFTEKELCVPRLPAPLDGLRIAHLSDLHMSGRLGVRYYCELIELILEAGPDLVALTGDLVEYNRTMPWVDETLARLKAPEGVYFVLGNHDLNCDHQRLRGVLTDAGLIDLGGGRLATRLRGESVLLVGNELPWFHPAGDPSRSEGQGLVIGLAHGPDQFRWAERHEVDLLLAGHNHGGQIRIPPLGAIVTPSIHGTRYAGGVFRRDPTVMHVSRGAGSLAPVRYNCPPEVSVLTLRGPEDT